jgi:hypothetical protein
MSGTVKYDRTYQPFNINSGGRCQTRQCSCSNSVRNLLGCHVEASIILKHAFTNTNDRIYLNTRSDGRLFNLARLKAKTKCKGRLVLENYYRLIVLHLSLGSRSTSDYEKSIFSSMQGRCSH